MEPDEFWFLKRTERETEKLKDMVAALTEKDQDEILKKGTLV